MKGSGIIGELSVSVMKYEKCSVHNGIENMFADRFWLMPSSYGRIAEST